MKDYGVVAFWGDDLTLLLEEFKEEFNRITDVPDGASDGLYTFILSTYNEYKVFTEVFYVQILNSCAIFLWAPYSLVLNLDDELQVVSGDFIPDGSIFLNMMIGDIEELSYIGPITDCIGNCYEIFSLKYENPYLKVLDMYECEYIDVSNISISDDVIMDASMKFLEYKIELFAVQVESSIDSNNPDISIEENPLQNMYFDRAVHTNMMREKRMIGAASDV